MKEPTELQKRIEALETFEVVGVLNDLPKGYLIVDSCESRRELNAVLECNILDGIVDEIILITIESGK